MSNENNNQFNNEARENHDGQFGHGQKRPYNRPKNYKYKPQHRNSYGRKPMQDRKAPADKEKNGIQVPFKAAIKNWKIENHSSGRTGTDWNEYHSI